MGEEGKRKSKITKLLGNLFIVTKKKQLKLHFLGEGQNFSVDNRHVSRRHLLSSYLADPCNSDAVETLRAEPSLGDH